MFYSLVGLYISPKELLRKKSIWIKSNFKKGFNVQICRHFAPPLALVFPWFEMSCDVDSGTCDFRLDSSRLFHVCKLHLVIHTKCWKGTFCMDYKAKFTEVKQAR